MSHGQKGPPVTSPTEPCQEQTADLEIKQASFISERNNSTKNIVVL